MNKTVLITGASRGIGRAIAKRFAKEGCRLVITCRQSEKELYALKQELSDSFHIPILTSIGDIGSYDYVVSLFREIESVFGGVDILINNAGIAHIGLLSEMTIEEWDRIVKTNLTSVFSTCHEAIPYMVRQKSGRIINISSVWGTIGASCETAYSACKGGVNAFSRALAKELAPSNIQVHAVAFGCIDTDMNACFTIEEKEALQEEIPAGRFGTPEEAAELVFDLASMHPYLTGQVITLDGGWC